MKTATFQKLSPFLANRSPVIKHLCQAGSWLFQQFSSLAIVVVLGTLSYLLVSNFIFQSVTVSGSSMYPTLFNDNHCWLIRSAYLKHEPQRTDIVAVKDPEDNGLVVKRIIAMPGESIYLNHGKVYVNGQLLKEDYLPDKTPTYAYEKNESEFFVLGKDAYFVMGDNRNNSCDSRTFGAVPRKNILGRVTD